MPWYLDSRATHHVCCDTSTLNGSIPYLGKSSLLMGDGTPTKISSIGNSILSTPHKLLRLSNVLCVPTIRKNLMFVSQFATDNNVFLNFI